MSWETLLAAHAVSKRVHDGEREVAILDGVSIEVAPGERVALLGPSGAGKSTLLHILGALDPVYQGEVIIAGQCITGLDDGRLARFRNQTLGFVFQSYNLLGHLTVLENVLLPARFARERPDTTRAMRVLADVGLGNKSHRKPATLSGGERQRVAIARALYHQPKVVLCDEPTGNLDAATGKDVLALIDRMVESGAAVLVATHDDAIASTADRVLRLGGGRLQ